MNELALDICVVLLVTVVIIGLITAFFKKPKPLWRRRPWA